MTSVPVTAGTVAGTETVVGAVEVIVVGKQKETCANQVSSNLEPLERKINEREIGSCLEVTGNG